MVLPLSSWIGIVVSGFTLNLVTFHEALGLKGSKLFKSLSFCTSEHVSYPVTLHNHTWMRYIYTYSGTPPIQALLGPTPSVLIGGVSSFQGLHIESILYTLIHTY